MPTVVEDSVAERVERWCADRELPVSWRHRWASIELPATKDLRRALGLTYLPNGTFQASVYVTDGRAQRGMDHCYSHFYTAQSVRELETILERLRSEALSVQPTDLKYTNRASR